MRAEGERHHDVAVASARLQFEPLRGNERVLDVAQLVYDLALERDAQPVFGQHMVKLLHHCPHRVVGAERVALRVDVG